jgi:outer membrane protein assembly factor BamD (BamD/ComL family)
MNKGLAILLPLLAVWTVWAAPPGEFVWQDGQWVQQPPPNPDTPEGQLAMIRRDIDLGRFSQAVDAAKEFLKTHPGDSLREQAYDLAGHAEMRRGLYWQAYEFYDKLLKEFPSGSMVNRAVDREAEIAKAFLAGKKRLVLGFLWLDATSEGIDILQKIPQFVPGTVRAENALLTVADWYYEKDKAREAADAYDAYLRLFPYAPRAAFAEFRAAESMRKAYRGPAFEDTTLIEALQRFKAFAEHRPAAAAETRVDQIIKSIRADLAAKQLWIAQFYVRTDHEDSAAYYYRFIITEYGDTSCAQQARADLAELKKANVPRPRRPRGSTTQPAEGEPTTQKTIVFPPEPLPILPFPATAPASAPATQPATQPAVEALPAANEPEPAAESSEQMPASQPASAPASAPTGGPMGPVLSDVPPEAAPASPAESQAASQPDEPASQPASSPAGREETHE